MATLRFARKIGWIGLSSRRTDPHELVPTTGVWPNAGVETMDDGEKLPSVNDRTWRIPLFSRLMALLPTIGGISFAATLPLAIADGTDLNFGQLLLAIGVSALGCLMIWVGLSVHWVRICADGQGVRTRNIWSSDAALWREIVEIEVDPGFFFPRLRLRRSDGSCVHVSHYFNRDFLLGVDGLSRIAQGLDEIRRASPEDLRP